MHFPILFCISLCVYIYVKSQIYIKLLFMVLPRVTLKCFFFSFHFCSPTVSSFFPILNLTLVKTKVSYIPYVYVFILNYLEKE